MPTWTPVFPSASLAPGAARVARAGSLQVAVFRTDDGALLAVDNRCPHEGYPLSQGALCGTTVTCTWHNFKFDGRTGACLMGDEDVVPFGVREVDGQVEVDLTPPTPDVARLERSLDQGLLDRNAGRIARDVVRLLAAGRSPEQIVTRGVAFDAERGEYGPSHGLPTLADILDWTDTRPGLDAALPLAQALDVPAEANLRRPPRRRGPLAPLPSDPAAELRRAVEAEDALGAEGLVRGLVAAGWSVAALDRALLPIVADHFLDFGHALIFHVKLFHLAARVPSLDLDLLLGAHVHGITTGTREDLLPAWSGYRARWAGVDPDALAARRRPDRLAADGLVELDAPAAFRTLVDAAVPVPDLLAALSRAAAERVLRFDPAIDSREGIQDDWLDVTHRFTFVNAVRDALPRASPRDAWRLLTFAAHFVGTARAYDGPRPPLSAGEPDAPALHRALLERRATDALAHAVGLVERGHAAALRAVLEEVCLADVAVRGIVVAHLVKMTRAAWAEWTVTGDPTGLYAVTRWFASPVAERRYGRRVAEARRLVTEGKPPVRIVP